MLLASCSSGDSQGVAAADAADTVTAASTATASQNAASDNQAILGASGGDLTASQASGTNATQGLNDFNEVQIQNTDAAEPSVTEPPAPEAVPKPEPTFSWKVTRILDRSPTSKGQIHTQQTPIDTKDGYVYVVGIEPGANGDGDGIRQTTTIKQGRLGNNNEWEWSNATISDNTLYDPYHTAPAVGIDRDGKIHVAYNMHNTPWQYVVSSEPHSLEYFEFKGQAVSDADLSRLEFENASDFDSLGTGAITGSQISYPAFFRNKQNQLFITYRAAVKPARDFWERTMSGMVASYDEQSAQWTNMGAKVALKADDVIELPGSFFDINALASETGWTVYHPKLAFTATGEMHVILIWRRGIAGSFSSRPCHLMTSDGQNFYTINGDYIELPLKSSHCGNMSYNNDELFTHLADLKIDQSGQLHALLSPIDNPRELLYYSKNEKRWIREQSPSNANHIFFDKNGRQWAIARGLILLYRDSLNEPWITHYSENHNDCFAKMVWNENMTKGYIHTQACDSSSTTVYELAIE